MIDTNELESLSIEELRTGIVLQRKEIDRLRAKLASRAGVPDGWKLVPVEPTREMLDAGMDVLMNQCEISVNEYGDIEVETITPRRVYRAMLAAAPSPEGQEAESAEKLGERCIDGGKCNHACTDRCFRRECCSPFDDYQGPWAYPSSTPAEGQAGEQEAGSLVDQSYKLAARLWHQWSKGNRGYFVNYAAAAIYEALAAQQQGGRGDE